MPFPDLEREDQPESPLGWTAPRWLAVELVWVADNWHFTPEEWLGTDNNLRLAMLKHVGLRDRARELYRKNELPGSDYVEGDDFEEGRGR